MVTISFRFTGNQDHERLPTATVRPSPGANRQEETILCSERWRYVFLLFPQTRTALSEELGDIADKTKVNSMASAGGYHSAEFPVWWSAHWSTGVGLLLDSQEMQTQAKELGRDWVRILQSADSNLCHVKTENSGNRWISCGLEILTLQICNMIRTDYPCFLVHGQTMAAGN